MRKCPGCSKHCCENAPRCKYGRAYFAKQQKKAEEPKYKWEANVTRGGLIWKLLFVNRKVKKAVCKTIVSEEKLLAALTVEEKAMLQTALEKLETIVSFEK